MRGSRNPDLRKENLFPSVVTKREDMGLDLWAARPSVSTELLCVQ